MKTSVEVLTTFIDRENEMKERQPGEIFEVKPERAKHLEILGLVKTTKKQRQETEKAD